MESKHFARWLNLAWDTFWFDPQIFWDNLQKIENISNSKEAIAFRTFCGDKKGAFDDQYIRFRINTKDGTYLKKKLIKFYLNFKYK